ncbi:MAG: TrbG/VirB9 family P-type conjugative transfer protein [Novosphingobium sp.]
MKRFAFALVLTAAPLAAQPARPLDGDARIETIEWREGATIPLRTTAGGALTVVFAPGEAVQSVVVGDPQAVQVAVPPQADSLLLRAARAPLNDSIEVRTQLRSYRFRVVLGPANDVAYAVRFSVSAADPAAPGTATPPAASNSYVLKGADALRPVRVSDDGQRTYIEWGADQALPAVFAVSPHGEEETVDAYMRGGIMVIDRVYSRLVFRVGKYKAQADRPVPGKRRG